MIKVCWVVYCIIWRISSTRSFLSFKSFYCWYQIREKKKNFHWDETVVNENSSFPIFRRKILTWQLPVGWNCSTNMLENGYRNVGRNYQYGQMSYFLRFTKNKREIVHFIHMISPLIYSEFVIFYIVHKMTDVMLPRPQKFYELS